MLFAKNRNSLDSTSSREQTVFLISSRGTEPRCCSSRLRPNKHFQDHQMAWGLRRGRGCTTMPKKASPWGWAEAGFGSFVLLDQYVHHLLVTWVQSTKLPSHCFCFSVCIHVDCAFGICSAGWAGRGLLLLLIDKPECSWTGSELKCLLKADLWTYAQEERYILFLGMVNGSSCQWCFSRCPVCGTCSSELFQCWFSTIRVQV